MAAGGAGVLKMLEHPLCIRVAGVVFFLVLLLCVACWEVEWNGWYDMVSIEILELKPFACALCLQHFGTRTSYWACSLQHFEVWTFQFALCFFPSPPPPSLLPFPPSLPSTISLLPSFPSFFLSSLSGNICFWSLHMISLYFFLSFYRFASMFAVDLCRPRSSRFTISIWGSTAWCGSPLSWHLPETGSRILTLMCSCRGAHGPNASPWCSQETDDNRWQQMTHMWVLQGRFFNNQSKLKPGKMHHLHDQLPDLWQALATTWCWFHRGLAFSNLGSRLSAVCATVPCRTRETGWNG